jgi:hypothetical protein
MASHVSHVGVHDHGFNNISTYGNLRRLMREGRIEHNEWEMRFYEMAIKASGAVQASRWSGVAVDQPSPHAADSSSLGYIYSFNGPHSLFIDTMRTLRSLGIAWQLGHVLMHEGDKRANLLKRAVLHAMTTSAHIVYHGDTDQPYDVAGRTAHEGVFNRGNGQFRCRATQQGYSPFSTWTRGLAWAILGFAEQLEFVHEVEPRLFERETGLKHAHVADVLYRCATQCADHYINHVSAADGIPYWDDGAPGLSRMGDWRSKPADPFNDHEPVDSSAAAIAAQGLIRLTEVTRKLMGYRKAGLTIARTLFAEPYLATDPDHQGLLLHSVYHRPNGWDHIPPGRKVPCGEASMWGDYHAIELAVYLKRLAEGGPYLAFFDQNI